jgi:hypothetical protein
MALMPPFNEFVRLSLLLLSGISFLSNQASFTFLSLSLIAVCALLGIN